MTPVQIERALSRIERELREFRKEAGRASAVPVVMVTVREAARSLSRSRSTVWELIRCGEIQTKTIGRTRLVPVSELHRLAEVRPAAARSNPVARSSVALEQEKVRAALRKRR